MVAVTATWRILVGDAIEQMRTLPDDSVHCCVTSPPYWGLRDYGVDGAYGREPTVGEYVGRMTAVFGEVKRVLRHDGTLWLNMGDGYNSIPGNGRGGERNIDGGIPHRSGGLNLERSLKPKDLIGMPWRVAFALQADGWWLRSDIIWAKPNPMPESVTDRPTRSHEFVFLLTKRGRYFYDADAIVEQSLHAGRVVSYNGTQKNTGHENPTYIGSSGPRDIKVKKTRNKRDVWWIPPQPYTGAHFATFPEKLVEPCILAGCPAPGKHCGCDEPIHTPTGTSGHEDPTMQTGRAGMNRPRGDNEGRRVITRRIQRDQARQLRESPHRDEMEQEAGDAFAHYIRTDLSGARPVPERLTQQWSGRGWLTTLDGSCDCPMQPGGTVLDPFCGSGTTGVVAMREGRSFVGVELNPEYVEMARQRIIGDAPLFNAEAERA